MNDDEVIRRAIETVLAGGERVLTAKVRDLLKDEIRSYRMNIRGPEGRWLEGAALRTVPEFDAALVLAAVGYGYESPAETLAEGVANQAWELRREADQLLLSAESEKALEYLNDHAEPGLVFVLDDGLDLIRESEADR